VHAWRDAACAGRRRAVSVPWSSGATPPSPDSDVSPGPAPVKKSRSFSESHAPPSPRDAFSTAESV
jgi:hypothetical protein